MTPPAVEAEAECDRQAAVQHGVISRDQALAAGLSRGAIDGRVASGRWKAIHPGVYAPRPVPPSWHQRLMAAVLWGGADSVASHRSAAALWELDGAEHGMIEISIKSGKRVARVIVHRRRPRDDPPVVLLQAIPATAIERTLADFAAVVSIGEAARALDAALRRRITSLDRLRELLDELGRDRRPGAGTLRRLVEERDDRDRLMESRLEAKLLRVLRSRTVPLPEPQFRVLDGDAFVARLDFAYPSQRIGIEADGYRWHASPERWRRDLRRENRLKLLGWTMLGFSWEDVRDRPEVVASQVRAAIGDRFPDTSPTRAR